MCPACRESPPAALLLHFFNPGCPCSRFNLDHIRELTRTYGERVNIVAVLEEDSTDTLIDGFRRTGLPIQAVVDSNRTLATAVGRERSYFAPPGNTSATDITMPNAGCFNASGRGVGKEYCQSWYQKTAMTKVKSNAEHPAARIGLPCDLIRPPLSTDQYTFNNNSFSFPEY